MYVSVSRVREHFRPALAVFYYSSPPSGDQSHTTAATGYTKRKQNFHLMDIEGPVINLEDGWAEIQHRALRPLLVGIHSDLVCYTR